MTPSLLQPNFTALSRSYYYFAVTAFIYSKREKLQTVVNARETTCPVFFVSIALIGRYTATPIMTRTHGPGSDERAGSRQQVSWQDQADGSSLRRAPVPSTVAVSSVVTAESYGSGSGAATLYAGAASPREVTT
jgi:hypothetical protein